MFKILHVTIITCSYHQKQRVNNNDADQTALLRRLRCAFVVRVQYIYSAFLTTGWGRLGGGAEKIYQWATIGRANSGSTQCNTLLAGVIL